MIIKKKRINNLRSNIGFVEQGTKVAVGITIREDHEEPLTKIGFTFPPNVGDTLLPPASFGPISRFNAEGKYIKHKDKPMETAYRTVDWHWTEYHGPYEVEQSDFVNVSYKRYPRTFIPPYGIELTVHNNTSNNLVLVSPTIEYIEENEDKLKNILNLFLEIFGECQLFTENLNEIVETPLRRLNWKLLPEGPMPWNQLQQQLNPIINAAPKGNQPFIIHRLEKINDYNPDFVATGTAGFWGYIIFGFEDKNIYICESIHYGNATYVFAEDWEELSKKTKAEILDNNLQKDRIIHRAKSWDKQINELLS